MVHPAATEPNAKVLAQVEKRRAYIVETYLDKLVQRMNPPSKTAPVRVTRKGLADQRERATALIDRVLKMDATPTKKNSAWLISRYIDGSIKRIEDFHKFAVYLKSYETLRPGGYFARYPDQNTEFGDITKLTPGKLADFVDSIDTEAMRSRAEIDREREEAFFKSKAAVLWLDDENSKIVRIYTWEASKYFGRNTRWCTAAEDDYETFHDYVTENALLIALDKKTNRRWQLAVPFRTKLKNMWGEYAFSDGEVMLCDERDDDIDIEYHNEKIDDIREWPSALMTMIHMVLMSPLYQTTSIDPSFYFITSGVWTEENFHTWEEWLEEKGIANASDTGDRFHFVRALFPSQQFLDARSVPCLDHDDGDDFQNLRNPPRSPEFIKAIVKEDAAYLAYVDDPLNYLDDAKENWGAEDRIIEMIFDLLSDDNPLTKGMVELVAEIDPERLPALNNAIKTSDEGFKAAVRYLMDQWDRPLDDLKKLFD